MILALVLSLRLEPLGPPLFLPHGHLVRSYLVHPAPAERGKAPARRRLFERRAFEAVAHPVGKLVVVSVPVTMAVSLAALAVALALPLPLTLPVRPGRSRPRRLHPSLVPALGALGRPAFPAPPPSLVRRALPDLAGGTRLTVVSPVARIRISVSRLALAPVLARSPLARLPVALLRWPSRPVSASTD